MWPKLRALKTDTNPLVFMINMHGGMADGADATTPSVSGAFNYAFMLEQMGIAQ